MTQPSTATVDTTTEAAAAPGAAPAVPENGGTAKSAPADSRTPEQIEAQLQATRARLAGRIDDLQAYVAPKAVLSRQLGRVRSIYVDEFGGVRPERVLATAGVLAAIVGVALLRRRSRR